MPKAAQVWPNGSAIELESRDVHISVNGLLAAFFRRCFRPRPSLACSRAVAARRPLRRSEAARKRMAVGAGAREKRPWPPGY